jgi:uncharacterized ferritin-like protein (DUF455 family)
MTANDSLCARACAVLRTADPAAKAAAGAAVARDWRDGAITNVGACPPPLRPARPARPVLRRPGDMPRRRTGGPGGRIALLHAVAHIELNAIDLAWDLIARFTDAGLPRAFYDDWVDVAADEGRHFSYLAARLAELNANYGDLPAHDGLWRAAVDTAGDLTARLAVVPMLLEARGLDVTPAMVEKLRAAGDDRSAAILQLILDEEIGHVATGCRWFEWSCRRLELEPVSYWRVLVAAHFKGVLKPPFNHAARNRAGMAAEYYQPEKFC